MADDTWYATDLHVLEAVVALLEEHQAAVSLADIATRAELSVDDVSRAIVRLEDEYVDVTWAQRSSGGKYARVRGVTSAARRAVGQWPSGESIADRVLTELDERVAAASDADERSKLAKARDALAGMGRDVLADVAGAAVSRSMGGL